MPLLPQGDALHSGRGLERLRDDVAGLARVLQLIASHVPPAVLLAQDAAAGAGLGVGKAPQQRTPVPSAAV